MPRIVVTLDPGITYEVVTRPGTTPPPVVGWATVPNITLDAGGAAVAIGNYYTGTARPFAATKPLPAGVTLNPATGVLTAAVTAPAATLTGLAFTAGAVVVEPPPVVVPPPPVIPPIPAPSGMFEKRGVAYRPDGFGGAAKHLRFCKVGSLYYKMVGDHSRSDVTSGVDFQGGRQEIHSLDLATNQWKMHEGYWPQKPAGAVALFSPDDGAACTVRDEIWVFVSARNATLHQPPWTPGAGNVVAPPGTARYYTDQIMAYNPTTKLWRVIGPTTIDMWGNKIWHAVHDPVGHHVLFISQQGNGSNYIVVLDDVTGTKITQWRTGPTDKGYCHSGGLPIDVVGRKAWAWETFYGSTVHEINLDTGVSKQIAVCPEPGTGNTESSNAMAGPTKSGKLLFFGSRLHILTLATGAWQSVDREDGFRSKDGAWHTCLTAFYDPVLDATCSIGTVDWSTGEDIGAYYLVRV